MKVLIVNTGLNPAGNALLSTIQTVTDLPHDAVVVPPFQDFIEGHLDASAGRCLLVFTGGVPKTLVQWLTNVLEIGKIPVFITIANPDATIEWQKTRASIFTTGISKTVFVRPWTEFGKTLKAALGLS